MSADIETGRFLAADVTASGHLMAIWEIDEDLFAIGWIQDSGIPETTECIMLERADLTTLDNILTDLEEALRSRQIADEDEQEESPNEIMVDLQRQVDNLTGGLNQAKSAGVGQERIRALERDREYLFGQIAALQGDYRRSSNAT